MKLLRAIFLIWPLHAFSQAEPPLPANQASECVQGMDVCALKALLRLISEVESVNTCDDEAVKEYFSASSDLAIEKGTGSRPLPMVPIVITTPTARPDRCMLELHSSTNYIAQNKDLLIKVSLDDLKSQIALCYSGEGAASHGPPLVSFEWCENKLTGGKSIFFNFRRRMLDTISITWRE